MNGDGWMKQVKVEERIKSPPGDRSDRTSERKSFFEVEVASRGMRSDQRMQ
jgi:hypothetical protein